MEIAKVNIAHPEKILYPELAVDKAEVAAYYNFIAVHMLPYIKNRPLSLRQYPHGIDKPGFFHKHSANFYPRCIQRFIIPTSHHGDIEMVGVATAEGLVYLSVQNTIEFHMSLAHVNNIKKPDQIILDFDPSDDDFEKVRTLALQTKEILDQQGLISFVKTTGSRGLHVHIPLKPQKEYVQIKPIAKQLAEYLQQQCPDIATVEHRKIKRGNKVFIDYLRNDYSATAVAPYSLRANKWAGIATPVSWDEVRDKKLQPYTYNIKNIQQRVKTANPWRDFR
jgi:bifunctional non-homologous end joining protein LigD